jgi:hypothetical protein
MFKNFEDFRQYVQVSNGLTLKAIQASIENALHRILYPCIPKNEAATLLAEYNANSFTSPIREEGFYLLQNLVAKFTFFFHIPFWGLTANDAQLGRKKDDVSLYKWESLEIKEAAYAQAYELVERTLAFFETNVSEFPLYQAHQQRKDLQSLFVRNYKTFAQFCALGNNHALYVRMHQYFPKEQYFYLRNLLGQGLYTQLQTQWLNNTASPEEKTVIADYLQPLLIYKTLIKALKELPITYSNGLLSFTYANEDATEQRSTATNNQLQIVANEYQNEADAFEKELLDYLNDNTAIFPLFTQSKSYTPPPITTDSWNDGTKALFSF